jgi:hypothetical protein
VTRRRNGRRCAYNWGTARGPNECWRCISKCHHYDRSRYAINCLEIASRVDGRPIESAMPLLEHNIHANARFFPENTGAKPEAMVLDWDDEVIPERIESISRQRGFNVIM